MGRGRVELRLIENKINRQVTFSKRRSGLLKKAHEISVLCDADIALIIFSPKGKLYEYSTENSMEKILERYRRHSYVENSIDEAKYTDHFSKVSWCHEYEKLKAKAEALQKRHRHLMGEQLDAFTYTELQQLEEQLDTSLQLTRSRKNQLMFDSIHQLRRKEMSLEEQKSILENKIMEKYYKHKALAQTISSPSPTPARQVLPIWNMIRSCMFECAHCGVNYDCTTGQGRATTGEEEEASGQPNGARRSLLPWMLN